MDAQKMNTDPYMKALTGKLDAAKTPIKRII